MKIAYVTNAGPGSGVGHRAFNIAQRLETSGEVDLLRIDMAQQVKTLSKWPGVLGTKTVSWLRLGGKVKKEIVAGDLDVLHLTNQTLSFLVSRKAPSVVTVHDIIEMRDPQTKGAYLVNKYLYSGIRQADHLIAVSNYTTREVREYYGVPEAKITVIPNGVDEEFHVIDNFANTVAAYSLRQEFKLTVESQVVLYVGSDHSRKNVVGAVRAFAKAEKKIRGLVFVKVGEPGIAAGRRVLLEEIDKLGIRDAVRFVGNVTETRLNELYNLADVLVCPSRLEGFGLPPLQAMAAGTPVVCSNATSLPEVVGEAALTHDPDDIEEMAESIEKVIGDKTLASSLQKKGLERAKKFSWDEVADKVAGVYRKLI